MGRLVLYIMEWAFALIILLTIYKAVFSGTTFYRFNRFYLLGATVLSALLPLVHITIPEKTPMVSGMAISDTEFAQELSGTFSLMNEPQLEIMEPAQSDNGSRLWAVILVCMYSGYVLMLMIGWIRSIIRARRFLRGKPRRRISRTVWLVTHDEEFGPFSWMNYIVISDTENGFARRASLRHEYSHVKLLHSVDLVFLLACTIFNPVCWLVLQEIKIVHEYEADHEVISHHGIRNGDYQKLLIMRTVGAEAYALASSFNLNIKKRINMLNKNQTRKRRLMWLLILIPALGITSVLFARSEKSLKYESVQEKEEDSDSTVVPQSVGNTANLDVSFTDPSNGQQMDLTKDVSEFPVLLVYDYNIIEKDNDSKDEINLDKGSYTQKELAAILGVKPEQIKAFMIRKGIDATSIWGPRGNNGVLEILSPQKYSRLQKEDKLDVRYKVAE